MDAISVYGASSVKRRRRTKAELAALDEIIVGVCDEENPISVRGVYYRVVSAGAIDKTEAAYKTISRRLKELRLEGRVPYHWITDGTRLTRKPETWSTVETMLADAAASYRRALWDNQEVEVIVLSEKDAISGVIFPVTAAWDVELGIARGYSSITFAHSIAGTVTRNTRRGKTTVLYNLGDHDPSGLDAWRDFQRKVRDFAPDGLVEFDRLAVTEQQIVEWDLPTHPTKGTDSRSKNFIGASVEVDAIPSPRLRQLVTDAIEKHIDHHELMLTKAVEEQERDMLTQLVGGAQ